LIHLKSNEVSCVICVISNKLYAPDKKSLATTRKSVTVNKNTLITLMTLQKFDFVSNRNLLFANTRTRKIFGKHEEHKQILWRIH
jgi:hypothetical protein